ncbi:MAG: hypothetical protein ACOCV8_02090 [Spirochaetota bacterium]
MKIILKNISIVFLVLLFIFPLFLSDNKLNSQEGFFDDEDSEGEFDDLIEDFISSFGRDPSNPLSLSRKDVIFTKGHKYIDLYVKKREQINSILIIYVVEEELRGEKVNVDYGLRALEYNEINGDEIRVLKGVELGKEQGLYFLVDSTPEPHNQLGQAFRIRIPTYVQYGYTKENFGLVRIDENTQIKVRTFEKPYADYSGKYYDNFFIISTTMPDDGDDGDGKPRSGDPVIKPDDYVEGGSTKITKDNKFIVAYLRYEDDSKYFKELLIKDELSVQSDFKPVAFKIDDEPENNKAVLLSSIYQNGIKVIRLKLYLERMVEERMVVVSAIDGDENKAKEPVNIRVPRIGEDIGDEYQVDNVPGEE